MMHTPDFPPWRGYLAPMGSRTAQAFQRVRAHTLAQLETCFGRWVPPGLSQGRTQNQQPRSPLHTVAHVLVRPLAELQSGRLLPRGGAPTPSALSVARRAPALRGGRCLLPREGSPAEGGISQGPLRYCPGRRPTGYPLQLLGGRPVKVADGSALTLLADTAKNRAAYPAVQCRPGQPSFPMMRMVVLFSLLSGSILAVAQGSQTVSELALLAQLLSQLAKGDILVGDRGFGCYPLIALLRQAGIDFVGRPKRQIDGRRRLKRLGPNDWLLEWKKGAIASPWLSPEQRRALPLTLTLRLVKGSLHRKGFRVHQVTVVTTLLDAELYPAREILEAYLRRWRLEMCLDDLKTTSAWRACEVVRRELFTRLIAHNRVRCVMAETATQHQVPLDRISFKGSSDAVRHFALAMAQARSKKNAKSYGPNYCELWLPIRSPSGRDDANLAPSNVRKTDTLGWWARGTSSAIILNAMTAVDFQCSESGALCKRHSPYRAKKIVGGGRPSEGECPRLLWSRPSA